MRFVLTLLAAVAFLGLTAPAASAAVFTLTGGDAGDAVAFTPLPTTVYAYEVNNPGTGDIVPANNTVQGITFVPFNIITPPANFTLSGASGNFEGVVANFNVGPFPNTASDTALKNAVSYEAFTNSGVAGPTQFDGPMVLTIGGLTTGQEYQVDLFVYSNFSRPATYDIGGAIDSFAGGTANVFDIRESVVAVGGQITVTVTGIGNDAAFLNAFAVTVPEPASIALLGAGATLILRCRHRAA